MKSSKMKVMALALAAVFTFAGCGEALYELTPEEEAAIVSYASHVVAKYNTYQRDGEIYVDQEILDGEEEKPDQSADTSQAMPDTEETGQDIPLDEENTDQTGQETESPDNQSVSIEDALGIDGITTQYGGSSLCGTFDQSDSYVVDADKGKQLLVLNIKLSNETGEDMDLDILQKKPSFEAVVNGERSVKAQMTILSNDLTTYQGHIPAGESVDTVLIFQIPAEIEAVSGIELDITADGSRYTVNL